MFYLAAASLLAAGALLVAFALRSRSGEDPQVSRDETVKALYRERLEELRAETAASGVAPDEGAELEQELGAALLADYREAPGEAQGGSSTTGRGVGLIVASAALVVVVTVGVYLETGDPGAMRIAGAEAVFELDPSRDARALADWRLRLEERLNGNADDAKSWYLLGHIDLKSGRFTEAANAFAMARRIHGDDPGLDVLWLQAHYLAAGGEIDPDMREIAEHVLANDPNQPTVLEILAIDAFRRESFFESVSLLNRALSGSLEPGHRSALESGYVEARQQLGDLNPAVDVAIDTETPVPAGRTLFVIARPVGGGMPFAVVRRPAGEFPTTIRLDDAVSMNPAAPLSSAGEVEVVVRISRAGTAMAHPGDWEWRSGPLALSAVEAPVVLDARLSPPS